ncbi:xanthine dehydrogenase accessory protein XdhC [Halomonas cupida]|uniref:Xanthine dehydrogenase accessory factor n=1 Tax=Halomonas cupida TaxID=44933 RepID=A0A1M7AVR4_9GAMM|nr:xanthine dehydrogenase accessory protein XdhC [Halomonas cupida]GEN22238.1 xanthine dehydrogenase accessory protein XdhC [Halomonas cupida]SHL46840.1 xanthine dehydrogenase accessory factor [Halomonas cupida]
MNREPWYEALARLQRDGMPHVVATQVTSQGSTPREPGARMIITPDRVYDTLGGGTFEWQVIAAARDNLAAGKAGMQLEAFSLGGRSGQCCGGFVNVILETWPGSEVRLALFGAGHVGRHIAHLVEPLDWRLDWYDSRDDGFAELPDASPRQHRHTMPDPQAAVDGLASHSHLLILTHDHAEDYALVDAALKRGDCASIGLIGSRSKWVSFRRRLEAAGHTAEAISTVRCPIGDSGGNKAPYAVALSAVAELQPICTRLDDKNLKRGEGRGIDGASLRSLFN